jgi:hypothetical protein
MFPYKEDDDNMKRLMWEVKMSEREIHLLPEYTEQAMGYVWDKPIVRWIAVYQRLKGDVVWHDGMTA